MQEVLNKTAQASASMAIGNFFYAYQTAHWCAEEPGCISSVGAIIPAIAGPLAMEHVPASAEGELGSCDSECIRLAMQEVSRKAAARAMLWGKKNLVPGGEYDTDISQDAQSLVDWSIWQASARGEDIDATLGLSEGLRIKTKRADWPQPKWPEGPSLRADHPYWRKHKPLKVKPNEDPVRVDAFECPPGSVLQPVSTVDESVVDIVANKLQKWFLKGVEKFNISGRIQLLGPDAQESPLWKLYSVLSNAVQGAVPLILHPVNACAEGAGYCTTTARAAVLEAYEAVGDLIEGPTPRCSWLKYLVNKVQEWCSSTYTIDASDPFPMWISTENGGKFKPWEEPVPKFHSDGTIEWRRPKPKPSKSAEKTKTASLTKSSDSTVSQQTSMTMTLTQTTQRSQTPTASHQTPTASQQEHSSPTHKTPTATSPDPTPKSKDPDHDNNGKPHGGGPPSIAPPPIPTLPWPSVPGFPWPVWSKPGGHHDDDDRPHPTHNDENNNQQPTPAPTVPLLVTTTTSSTPTTAYECNSVSCWPSRAPASFAPTATSTAGVIVASTTLFESSSGLSTTLATSFRPILTVTVAKNATMSTVVVNNATMSKYI